MADQGALRDEARTWFEEQWDPTITVGEWWARLFAGGWSAPAWPQAWYGRGLSTDEIKVINEERTRIGAAAGPGGLGVMLAGPTLLAHGTPEQKARYLPGLLRGEEAWCQLFSEPGAGSDLAGLSARAIPDANGWTITGQKVWSSGAHTADLGMLLARTHPDRPKHQGITWFIIDMDQPGIEVRPIREMTGRALFNEVFLEGARVPGDAVVGEFGGGWNVTRTTLAAERSGLGGGSDAAGGIPPGRRAGMLGRPAGTVAKPAADRSGTAVVMSGRLVEPLLALAREVDADRDPFVRQQLAELWTLQRISSFTSLRARAAARAGRPPGPEVSTQKLAMSRQVRVAREAATAILGAQGLTVGAPSLSDGVLQEIVLFSPGPSIYGGTDEIQRNIIGERVLGLPKEPTS